jgi:sortase A
VLKDITVQALVSTATPVSQTITQTQQTPGAPLLQPTTEVTATATTSPPPEVLPSSQPVTATEEALSLADNPLLVAPEAATPEGVETEEAGATATPEAMVINRIVAESIELDAEVIEVGWQEIIQDGVTANAWTVADYAAGWHQNSALPGQGGNIVLSGHHNINGEVFRYIVDLQPGDIVTLYDAEQTHEYVIVDKFIVKDKGEPEAVRRANARWIEPFNEERLTLVTCWPYNNNTHRVIVIGKPANAHTPEQ